MYTDLYEGTKKKIDENLKKIEELNMIWHNNQDDPEHWFKAWGLLKQTANLVEELEQEYYRLNGKENLN